ncbi:MAG: hypothetical protein DM484_05930 [Candidatus Methylumidiphilus alinenensis]|uniref:Uncharacterized protein n=1 Tax=Candidatus Methylumidiphilus alinenensis TaxID=2202197 RepID=A0A2W4TJW2_9GAMM|nr:MAG: hypothetical protein DM484_05930 [Candidatus Methylumidiphilus alinenensis]
MSYSDFTLKKVKDEFGLNVVEDQDLFSRISEIQISEYLSVTLNYNVPLAMAVGTEKARSEFIIANILLELRKILYNKISLFSGIILDVDKERGLTGFCDFIISKSQEQFYISAPIIAVVEAKNENLVGGLGQCIAEMYASSLFNQREGLNLPVIYGAVTTGNTWKFLRQEGDNVYIDLQEYHIANANKIIAILVEMVNQKA